ncbi:putative serine protease K12H4.7 [Leguminivora glycinivorella]|uniref:putative serine protease K12H4.7 n=1 Tax=Leguminivora glycinivorella TaxID=1035111 RepID=UPI00200E462C|nr:putative serine protease K12H4.7 [Leguminivora glycinivorella]
MLIVVDIQVTMYFCLVTLLIASATAFKSNYNYFLKNVDFTQMDLSSIEEKWIDQPLDHFDPNEKRTFKMRYFENLQFWQPNAPIYIFIGGEGEQQNFWTSDSDNMITGQMVKETHGTLFATEHRYYGKSMPDIPKDNAIAYHKFLRSEQALEDLASFIKMLKSDSKYRSSKVVVVGGSYAGNLAAWMRELYPELVDAAVAASAPVLAKKDFHEYLDVVRETFRKYGTEDCLAKIEKECKGIEDLLNTSDGREEIKKKYNICPDNDLTVLENQQFLFFLYVYVPLDGISQGKFPDDVKNWCNRNPLQFNPSQSSISYGDCYSVDFESFDWTVMINGWVYQFCNEFGYLVTTSSEKQPFVHWNPLDFMLKICKKYVKGDVETIMDEGIAKTNLRYGGLTPNVTKVVFSHGDMDPWHALGVVQDLGPEAPARVIKGTSHCGVLAYSFREPQEMAEHRKYVKDLIIKWIS